MTNRLVNTSVQILLSLPSNGSNVNKIITQTSSDRSHVSFAIKLLRKANIVNKEKDPKHKQGRIIKLTRLGVELQKLANGIKDYSYCFSALDRAVNERFRMSFPKKGLMQQYNMHLANDKETISALLRQEGYSESAIERYLKEDMSATSGLRKLLVQSPRFVLNILVFKYNFILQLNPNEQAHLIIRSIMINCMNAIMDGIRISHANITDEILALCLAISQIGIFDDISINNKTNDLLRSIFLVLDPDKERLREFVRSPFMQREIKRQNLKKSHSRHWLDYLFSLLNELIDKN